MTKTVNRQTQILEMLWKMMINSIEVNIIILK